MFTDKLWGKQEYYTHSMPAGEGLCGPGFYLEGREWMQSIARCPVQSTGPSLTEFSQPLCLSQVSQNVICIVVSLTVLPILGGTCHMYFIGW